MFLKRDEYSTMSYVPYTSDIDNESPTRIAAPGANKTVALLKILAFFTLVAMAAWFSYSIAQRFPAEAKNLLIAVDRLGITAVGAAEQARIYHINHMPITFEEKRVLIERTVFLGATREMVELALGTPVCRLETPAYKGQAAMEHWVYYIERDRKPTKLSFQNNELTTAAKASALDCR